MEFGKGMKSLKEVGPKLLCNQLCKRQEALFLREKKVLDDFTKVLSTKMPCILIKI
jgi:hypothetical protein